MIPLLPIIAAAAPALVSRLVGEGRGGALGAAVSAAVREVTGVDPSAGPEAEARAMAALERDAQAMAALKGRLAELSLAEAEALLADRADARARDVQIVKVLGRENRRADVMLVAAFSAVVGIAGVMFLLSLNKDAENSAMVNTLVGFLTGIGGMFARNIGTAFDFEFGSSRSSREKDGRIAELGAHAPSLERAGAAALGASAAAGARDALAAFRRRVGE